MYDVKIEGISLVANYRSSFSDEIQQSGIDGLIKSLCATRIHSPRPARQAAVASDRAAVIEPADGRCTCAGRSRWQPCSGCSIRARAAC